MKYLYFIFFYQLFIFYYLVHPAHSTLTIPGDNNYYIYSKDKFEIIYNKKNSKALNKIIKSYKTITRDYETTFNWQLDDKVSLIIASPLNQISNAIASVHPNIYNIYYGGGVFKFDYFSTSSWIHTLLTHELAHLYQLNPKSGLSVLTKKIFGNHQFFIYPIIPIPVFGSPNNLLPTWIIEGNAVFNESRFGKGGRLYNGGIRALFYSLLNEKNLINETRLTNNHLNFPYTTEKYIIGGYFNEFLSKKFGIKKVNQFFTYQSRHYFNPFILNNSFTEHFGRSYSELIQNFIIHYKKLAKRQRRSMVKPIIISTHYYPLNRIDGKILYLTYHDGKTLPSLNIYNIKKNKQYSKKMDLLPGKVFKIKGKYYTATNSSLKNGEIIYGLWGEEKKFLKNTHSKIIQDIKNKKTLYFDVIKSFDRPYLFLDKKSIGYTHSSAIMDEKNNTYYFKQINNIRTLYKSNKPIFSYQGHYGKVVDIGPRKEIYFIANTNEGATLFCYNNHHIYKLSISDTIVDAKRISKNLFFIVEIGAYGYEYKIINTQSVLASPSVYKYSFNRSKISPSSNKKAVSKIIRSKTTQYNALTRLRFNSWAINYTIADPNNNVFTTFNFNDPLSQNTLGISGSFSEVSNNEEYQYSVSYTNNQFVVPWSLYINYQNFPTQDYDGTLALHYPFFQFKRVKATTTLALIYEKEYQDNLKKYIAVKVDKKIIPPLSLFPYQTYSFQIEALTSRVEKLQSASLQFMNYIITEFYIQFETVYSWSNKSPLSLGERIGWDANLIPHQELLIYSDSNLEGGKLAVGFIKSLNQSLYSKIFPLSLRRWAPQIFSNYFYFKDNTSNLNFFEHGIGLTGEFLLGHNWPLKLSLNYTKRTLDHSTSWFINLGSYLK